VRLRVEGFGELSTLLVGVWLRELLRKVRAGVLASLLEVDGMGRLGDIGR
jgi:hypothetical protein